MIVSLLSSQSPKNKIVIKWNMNHFPELHSIKIPYSNTVCDLNKTRINLPKEKTYQREGREERPLREWFPMKDNGRCNCSKNTKCNVKLHNFKDANINKPLPYDHKLAQGNKQTYHIKHEKPTKIQCTISPEDHNWLENEYYYFKMLADTNRDE